MGFFEELFYRDRHHQYARDIGKRIKEAIRIQFEVNQALHDPDTLRDVIESINDRRLGKEDNQKPIKTRYANNTQND